MKRIMSAGLLAMCLLLIAVIAASPAASAAPGIIDPSRLDDGAVYTKEDMLAIYELGYKKGYQDGLDAGSTQLASVSRSPASDSGRPASYNYVLNTNTGKFHYPDCSSVKDMAEKNKEFFSGTREEAIARGYSPCGRCRP